MPGAALTQVQDYTLSLVEPHELHTDALLELVQVPLDGTLLVIPTPKPFPLLLQHINTCPIHFKEMNEQKRSPPQNKSSCLGSQWPEAGPNDSAGLHNQANKQE